MNFSAATLFGLVLFVTFCLSFTWGAVGMPRCAPCPDGDCPEPDNCIYGKTRDLCGRKVCAKGPGEPCYMRMFQMDGNCGDGTSCHCGRCTGCSLSTMECYNETCA